MNLALSPNEVAPDRGHVIVNSSHRGGPISSRAMRAHLPIMLGSESHVAVQPITDSAVQKRIENIDFLVSRCPEAFLSEFPVYLSGLGVSAATRDQVTL